MKNIEDEIKKIFFKLGSEITVHKINDENYIIDIDYSFYTNEMIKLFIKQMIIKKEMIETTLISAANVPSTIKRLI